LRIEKFRKLRRKLQHARIANRNTARISSQEFCATARFPNKGLAGINAAER